MTFFDFVNLISCICSITGISLLTIFNFFSSKTKYVKNLTPYVRTVIIIYLFSSLFTYKPWRNLHDGDLDKKPIYKIQHDTIIKYNTIVKYDTVYIKGNKIFNNKIRDVQTLIQH
ncbi:hypothetical protein BDD43_2838 [Mucilaginibacter gracilis]|uniref:Uncharacterized protein n=1 Tax=Mucilaginibacter gracilis TaxID=423350 RepID=A0A495J1H9_9SPHI|nr:hypothetical protein BDD43_2838 [Mucilaginibacter gracilis]